MQFFAILAIAATGVLAAPSTLPQLCPAGLLAVPQCCDEVVEGILGLGCTGITSNLVFGSASFQAHCAGKSKQAKCCALPIADLGVLCQDVPGSS